jgi:hypothetical protein
MISRWTPGVLAGAVALALHAGARAQPLPPPATTAVDAPTYDPEQLPAMRGEVRQFTLTGRGEIDGLILSDGTEVKTPPHLSSEIAYSIKPGDKVVIHGLRAAALPLVRAVSITNVANRSTVIDNGPEGPGRGRPPPPRDFRTGGGPQELRPNAGQVSGHVRMSLHGPDGDVNGALLDDGTMLRLPPPEAYRFANLLQPGQLVYVSGATMASPLGKVVDVEAIGASAATEYVLGPPAPPPGPPPRP